MLANLQSAGMIDTFTAPVKGLAMRQRPQPTVDLSVFGLDTPSSRWNFVTGRALNPTAWTCTYPVM